MDQIFCLFLTFLVRVNFSKVNLEIPQSHEVIIKVKACVLSETDAEVNIKMYMTMWK